MARDHGLNLTPEAIGALERKWLCQIDAPRAWRPRVPLTSQLTEALEIASVMDEAGTEDLLPTSAAAELRELCLVARSLHHRSVSLRADRTETRHAAAIKSAAHAWLGEAFQALRFLAQFNEDSQLAAQLKAIQSENASEDGPGLDDLPRRDTGGTQQPCPQETRPRACIFFTSIRPQPRAPGSFLAPSRASPRKSGVNEVKRQAAL